MIAKTLSFLVLTLLGAAHAVAAPCAAMLSQATDAPSLAYDPFDGAPGDATLTVEFTNGGDEPCTVALAVAGAGGAAERQFSNGAAKLRYLVKQQGAELANDLSSPAGVAVVEGGAGKRTTVSLNIEVPPGQIAPAGTYTDAFQLRAFNVTGGQRTPLGPDRTLQATLVVQPRAQVNIAGASGSVAGRFGVTKVDFGQMIEGAERSVFLQLRATCRATITVSSLNHGRLLHTVLREQAPGVPYTLRLDGVPIDLASGPFTFNRAPKLTLEGASYPLNIRLGDVAGRRAGEFQDLITIDVDPQ